MGKVLPFRRPATVEPCRRPSPAEALMAAQMRFLFAWAELVNPMRWGRRPVAAARSDAPERRQGNGAVSSMASRSRPQHRNW